MTTEVNRKAFNKAIRMTIALLNERTNKNAKIEIINGYLRVIATNLNNVWVIQTIEANTTEDKPTSLLVNVNKQDLKKLAKSVNSFRSKTVDILLSRDGILCDGCFIKASNDDNFPTMDDLQISNKISNKSEIINGKAFRKILESAIENKRDNNAIPWQNGCQICITREWLSVDVTNGATACNYVYAVSTMDGSQPKIKATINGQAMKDVKNVLKYMNTVLECLQTRSNDTGYLILKSNENQIGLQTELRIKESSTRFFDFWTIENSISKEYYKTLSIDATRLAVAMKSINNWNIPGNVFILSIKDSQTITLESGDMAVDVYANDIQDIKPFNKADKIALDSHILTKLLKNLNNTETLIKFGGADKHIVINSSIAIPGLQIPIQVSALLMPVLTRSLQ